MSCVHLLGALCLAMFYTHVIGDSNVTLILPMANSSSCYSCDTGTYIYDVCSEDVNWNNGQRTFIDPIPSGYFLTQVVASSIARYDPATTCGSESDYVYIYLNGNDLAVSFVNADPSQSPCNCSNCSNHQIVTFTSIDYSPHPFPTAYNYGSSNSFQIDSSFNCWSDFTMIFYYDFSCQEGCVNGTCISQNVCSCYRGFGGGNCSIPTSPITTGAIVTPSTTSLTTSPLTTGGAIVTTSTAGSIATSSTTFSKETTAAHVSSHSKLFNTLVLVLPVTIIILL